MKRHKKPTPGEISATLYAPLPPVAPFTAPPALDRVAIRTRRTWRDVWRAIIRTATPVQRAAFLDVANELREAAR